MFGQPPRSVVLPDVAFRDEEDLKDDTFSKVEDSRGEDNESDVDEIVKVKNNEDNCSRNDHDDRR